MTELTFIIPIGPDHTELAIRAIESARAQTVECEVLTMSDTQRRGPAALRNAMLMRTNTEFVCFLDADDYVEPTFAEETIAAYRRAGGNCYIFPDFVGDDGLITETPCLNNGMDGRAISTPDRKPYCGGTWHPITTLIPTAWARAVNGFDEQLPAVEDTDFYLKLCTTFRCGIRLARPLFHYTGGGKRSSDFRTNRDHDKVMGELSLRYGGKMGCCGDKTAIAKPVGEKQPGDVLAMALWHGNRFEFGKVSQRQYPRMSFPRTAWVDPRDVAFSPMLWKLLEQPAVDERAGLQTVAELAQVGMQTVKQSPYAPPTIEPDPPPVEAVKPDVARVRRLANKVTTDDPIFVFPEKDYPSYSDIKRLVALSGFESITPKQIDIFGRRPYIVVSPENPGQLNGLRAHVICWQLEYAGDYTHNYDGLNVDIWASDKAWADAHGAKYVLMGSHPELSQLDENIDVSRPYTYDVTMLGYMTPRRQAIKDQLSDLNWPVDYPGHGTPERNEILSDTHLMLHVHQHENAPYVAPQRIAIAAAYGMEMISERVADPGLLADVIHWVDYNQLSDMVRGTREAKSLALTHFLCIEHTFRNCVMEALNSHES